MRNFLKARIAPPFGIIALAAVIVFSMAGCSSPTGGGPSGGDPELSGTITISPNTNVTTGTELTATYSGKETVTLSYQWKKETTNVGTNSNKYTPTTAGSYTVTVSAAGYKSKTSDPVAVTGETLSELSGTISISPSSSVTTGTKLTATYSGSETVTLSYQWKRGTTNVGTNSNEYTPDQTGSYTVTVSASGYVSKTSAAVTVTAAASSAITYTVEQTGGTDGETDSTGIVFTFSGSVDSLGLTADDITVGEKAEKGADATLTGSGTTRTLSPITVTHAGEATVQITKSGIEAETKHVTVYKAGENAPTLMGITADYTGTATIYPTTPLNDLKTNLTVTAQYSDGDEETLSANEYELSGTLAVGTSTVTVTYTHDGVTKTDTFDVTVTAAVKVITFAIDTIAAQTYTGSALTPAVTVKDGATTLTLTTDYTVSYASNINAGTATVTITGAGNYAGSTGSATFTINKAAGAAITTAPTAATIGVTSVTLTAVTAPANGQTVEYASNTTNTAPTTGWQSGTTFTGLTGGTTYYFFARSAVHDNYNTGTASGASAAITTKQQATITINFAQIIDGAPNIAGPTISKTGPTTSATLTVTEAAEYTSIEWYIGSLHRSGATLTLNAANYSLGSHTITLDVVKGGVSYNRTITFTVAE